MQFFDFCGGCDEQQETQTYLEKIEKIGSRWKLAKERLEEARYLEKLIFADYVKTICSTTTIWDYSVQAIKDAQTEVGKNDKNDRKNISLIEDMLKSTFFACENVDIKIDEIITVGFEGFCYRFGFKIVDIEYGIEVPMRKAINIKNFVHAQEGKFAFYKKTSEHSSSVLFDDWTEAGLAKKIKEYLAGVLYYMESFD